MKKGYRFFPFALFAALCLNSFVDAESDEEDVRPSVKVYVYELPPRFNYEMFDDVLCGWNVRGYNHSFNGMGSPVAFAADQDTLRNNDQYTLEIVAHDRMLSYEHRVVDKSAADLFYVPFYIGYGFHQSMLDNIWTAEDQQSRLKTLSMDLLYHLRTVEGVTDDMWTKHFTVVGREEGLFSGGRFTLFSDPDMAPLKEMLRIHYRQDCRKEFGSPWTFDQTCPLEHNLEVVEVPQVATVHAVAGEKFPWREKYERPYLATFVGNDRKQRYGIIAQLQPQNCKNCRLETPDDLKNISGPTIEQVYQAYSTSEFCLQPWGDGPLRRGIYDSIALGCIPVFFVDSRKPWDGFLDYEDFSVTINPEDQDNIIKILENISTEKRTQLRSNIGKFGQYFQWSFGSPTIMDAFDMMMVEVSYIASARGVVDSLARTDGYCPRCRRFAERFSDAVQMERNIPKPSYRSEESCDADQIISDKVLQLLEQASDYSCTAHDYCTDDKYCSDTGQCKLCDLCDTDGNSVDGSCKECDKIDCVCSTDGYYIGDRVYAVAKISDDLPKDTTGTVYCGLDSKGLFVVWDNFVTDGGGGARGWNCKKSAACGTTVMMTEYTGLFVDCADVAIHSDVENKWLDGQLADKADYKLYQYWSYHKYMSSDGQDECINSAQDEGYDGFYATSKDGTMSCYFFLSEDFYAYDILINYPVVADTNLASTDPVTYILSLSGTSDQAASFQGVPFAASSDSWQSSKGGFSQSDSFADGASSDSWQSNKGVFSQSDSFADGASSDSLQSNKGVFDSVGFGTRINIVGVGFAVVLALVVVKFTRGRREGFAAIPSVGES